MVTHASSREEFSLQLYLISRLLRREIDVLLEETGLSEAAVLPIRYLVRAGKPLRQNELAEAMMIEGPTLVRVLDQLDARGLIARVEDPQDRRAKYIHVTPVGTTFHDDFQARLDTRREVLFGHASDEDLAAALRIFDGLEKELRRHRAS
jgi:MarR family transcriptional regulator for hemolysin